MVGGLDGFIKAGHKLQSIRRDSSHHQSPVFGFPPTLDQSPFFQTVEKPRDIRVAGNHAAGYFPAGESRRRAPQDSENVVLRRRQLLALEDLSRTAREQITGPQQIKKCCFLRAASGFPSIIHVPKIVVITTFVKTSFVAVQVPDGQRGKEWDSPPVQRRLSGLRPGNPEAMCISTPRFMTLPPRGWQNDASRDLNEARRSDAA